MTDLRTTCAALAVLALAAAMGGCQRTRVAEPLDAVINAPGEGSDMDFWHSLPGRSAVTNSEGLHGVFLLADGADPSTDWDSRLALAKERGWVSADFARPGDETIQRGTLAKAICRALDIKGGVMMWATNAHPRYAMRELAYLRIMAPSTENQVVNGLDYIGIMSKAQDFVMLRETKKARREAQKAGEASSPGAPEGQPATGEPASSPS